MAAGLLATPLIVLYWHCASGRVLPLNFLDGPTGTRTPPCLTEASSSLGLAVSHTRQCLGVACCSVCVLPHPTPEAVCAHVSVPVPRPPHWVGRAHPALPLVALADSKAIVDGNLKLILGLIWTLILHYSISMPMWDEEEDEEAKKQTPKQRLLGWIQNKLPQLPITNFSRDWQSGRALGALVDSCAPGEGCRVLRVKGTASGEVPWSLDRRLSSICRPVPRLGFLGCQQAREQCTGSHATS